jgi:hypothetical protein
MEHEHQIVGILQQSKSKMSLKIATLYSSIWYLFQFKIIKSFTVEIEVIRHIL